MKILVIDEEFPYPLNTGKRIRTFSLTRELAEHNDVSYLAYGTDGSKSFNFLQQNRIKCHAVLPPDRRQCGVRFYTRLLANLFSSLPYIVASHYTARFKAKFRELVDHYGYDVVICEWTPYAVYLKDLEGTKSIIVAHNIEANIWQRYRENETNPLKRAYIAAQVGKVEKFERTCFLWANGATAVSDIEAAEIAGYGVKYPVQTVENGVDVEYFRPGETETDPDMLVFTGSMDWRPNQDAVEFFIRDVFPLVRKTRPKTKIVVVGRKPPQFVMDLGKIEGVTVTGTVEDVRPYIARAALYVVPLRIGGGSRLKILEAMAMGKPVVSTRVGAEGLDVTHGQNIVISESTADLAVDIIRCLEDRPTAERIAGEGRILVEKHYRWENLGRKLQQYLTRVVEGS